MRKFIPLIYGLLLFYSCSSCYLRILLSAALTDKHFEFRKNQYITSFSTLEKYGYSDVYIVEALKKKGPTFLDQYSKNVFYATTNDEHCSNQGINESRTILEALYYYNFDPEDMIIKITGRHCLISDYFLNLVQSNPDYDAFVKVANGLMPAWQDGMIPTMCFAMKCKYLREFYEQINYEKMKEYDVPIEWVIASYIDKKIKEGNFKVYITQRLDIQVNAFASSASPDLPERIYIF